MPRNEDVRVAQTPIQLTAGDVEALFIFNAGPSSIVIAGAIDDQEPVMVGPVIQPGYAVPASIPIAELFPGVAGVRRVFAVAVVGEADVFVSHA